MVSQNYSNMEDGVVAPVQVAVRIRPPIPSDQPHDIICAYATPHQPPQPAQIILGHSIHKVDHAFNPDSTQSHIFQTSVAPLMDELLNGYDSSIITYGHINTGKTHTLLGPGVHFGCSEAEYGIIPRAVRYIFEKLTKSRNKAFSIKTTFLEVSNDSIRDLLANNQYQQEVVVDENAEGYPVIIGAQEVECENVSKVFNCLHAGMIARQVDSMPWNSDGYSSCHFIFQIIVEQRLVTADGLEEYRLSLATFADLASSVNYGPRQGSFNMDCGLIALNNVIASLIQWRTKDGCYQQSTLTRLLKESFGGRCYSLVVCCISPVSLNFDESLMTLRFADKVKNVQNTPKVSALLRVIESTLGKQSDQGEEDPAPTEDTFGLEFAASQWHKLVDNAEGLFKTLVNKHLLSETEKEQIEQWLCLKEECEEVVVSDEEETGTAEKDNRLEKIDEVTETEDKTDSSKDGESPPKPVETCETKESTSESESEADKQRPDFDERLEEHMDKLREAMEEAVAVHEDILDTEETDSQVDELNVHAMRACFRKGQRRRSVDRDTDMPLMRLVQQKVTVQEDIEEEEISQLAATQENTSRSHPQHFYPQQLQLLLAANKVKQDQIKLVKLDLEGAQTQLTELQKAIEIKEALISEMIKHSETRSDAKQKCQRKRAKLEEAYYKTRTRLAQVENALSLSSGAADDKTKLKKEIEKYTKLATHYDNRVKYLDAIKRIAGESTKEVLEFENSLHQSKRQLDKVKQWIERAKERKTSLEQELVDNEDKIKLLQYTFQQQGQESERGRSSASANEGERLQWIQVEEERLMKLRESSSCLQEQLIQRESILEKREAFLKEKICLEKQRSKSIMEVDARISHLGQVLKEKSTDLEHVKDTHEKEALRLEIHNLRTTRECLIDQRCRLERKVRRSIPLSTMEKRKKLELGEAVEAIDAAMEYKNELLCGRKGGLDSERAAREIGERMLMARLNELSPMEMRMLLYKYFQKVIDLQENGRKLEVQLDKKESTRQTCKIHSMAQLLRKQQILEEQGIDQIHRHYQAKVNQLFRLFAEDSSTEGAESCNEAVMRLRDGSSDTRPDSPAPVGKETKTKDGKSSEGKNQFRRMFGWDSKSRSTLKTLQRSGKPARETTVRVEKKKLVIQQNELPHTAK